MTLYFAMEILCTKQLQRIARIFELGYSVHHQWQSESRKREQGRRSREREREEAKEEADTSERNPRWVGPLPPVLMSHGVENGVPLRGLHVGTKILIEALSWAAVLSFDFKGFSYF